MTVEGASPALLRELLQDFEIELRNQKVPVDQWLQPGAEPAAVRAEFSERGLFAPEEAVVWFGWHNGRREVPGSEQALPMFTAESLGYLRADWLDADRITRGYEEWDWNPNWVQIIGDQVGVAVCCADDPANPPLVRAITADGVEGTQEWQTDHQVVSLCTPVTWWIDSLRRGWYRWDPKTEEWHRDLADQPLITAVYGLT
jgi:hypothetical protein